MEKEKTKKVKKAIIMQAVFLIAIAIALYLLYPKTRITLNGNEVNFQKINANVIVLSENPDFSNPRYLDLNEREEITFKLNPGNYYWKASNGIIEGMKEEFIIQSEVGMKVEVDDNGTYLENIGNVKLNVTKNKQGRMVGHIILEPSENQEIEEGEYIGRQND